LDEVEFGRYLLIAMIGEGGMGKVYKAHDTVNDRDVAIKVLPTDMANEAGYRERFLREAHIAAQLTEPHIVPIHDAGEIDGHLYLVMPIIDGTDVATLLKRDGPMSPRLAVKVIAQLAAAPRDKPATKITDSVLGALAYMAPERYERGTVDARTDVYALACVLHEGLTGNLPFPGGTPPQQMHAHRYHDPPRPSAQKDDIPTGFDEVVARGMAKNPDKRYQTASELAAAARQALKAPADAGSSLGLAAEEIGGEPTVDVDRRQRARSLIDKRRASIIRKVVAVLAPDRNGDRESLAAAGPAGTFA
jgi:serine/threonine protein kinase